MPWTGFEVEERQVISEHPPSSRSVVSVHWVGAVAGALPVTEALC
jgi:hypothetical protein